jgi:hypothetical protein
VRTLLNTVVGCALCVMSGALSGQRPRPATHDQRPATDSLQVFLITIGQGSEVWEKFGHNALWFRNSTGTIDISYNWGTFDFDQPHFLQRFLTGDTRYWVVGIPGTYLIEAYREYDRTVVLQRLHLTQEQARRAFEFAQWNARDENKYYRYDYYLDNCSTRVRDLIDFAVGGQLKTAMRDTVSRTYRTETLRLLDDMKLMQLGVEAALGEPADRHLTKWQDAFIPMRLRNDLRDVKVRTPIDTGPVPLVEQELTAFVTREYPERASVPSLWLPYLIAGLLVGAELVVLARLGFGARQARAAQIAFLIESGVWAFVIGIGGLMLLLAWTSTRHVFWFRNESLLLLNPLALWLAALIPMSRFRRPAAVVAVIIMMLGALALVAKAIPGSQQNVPLVLLILPIHIAVAYGLRARVTRIHASLARS